jgi:hypothetical protein
MISAKVRFNKAKTSEAKLHEQLSRIDKSIDKIHKKYFVNEKTYGGNFSSEVPKYKGLKYISQDHMRNMKGKQKNHEIAMENNEQYKARIDEMFNDAAIAHASNGHSYASYSKAFESLTDNSKARLVIIKHRSLYSGNEFSKSNALFLKNCTDVCENYIQHSERIRRSHEFDKIEFKENGKRTGKITIGNPEFEKQMRNLKVSCMSKNANYLKIMDNFPDIFADFSQTKAKANSEPKPVKRVRKEIAAVKESLNSLQTSGLRRNNWKRDSNAFLRELDISKISSDESMSLKSFSSKKNSKVIDFDVDPESARKMNNLRNKKEIQRNDSLVIFHRSSESSSLQSILTKQANYFEADAKMKENMRYKDENKIYSGGMNDSYSI